jgi:N-acetylglucosamine-6-phosphate deacetylase
MRQVSTTRAFEAYLCNALGNHSAPSMQPFVLRPTRVLTPAGFEHDRFVLVEGEHIKAIARSADCPIDLPRVELSGDLVPGFVDLQVNGGGGVLFNDEPTVAGIEAIGIAHRQFGTTGFLPTLISDDLPVIERALGAVQTAIERGVPGILGIHIEGPFLNATKCGIHDPNKLRSWDATAVDLLCSLRGGVTLVTLAPEIAPTGVIRELTRRGVIVSAGHTAATFEQIAAGVAEGLTGLTHLYNAMSPLTARAPGAVGAALDLRDTWAGVICDGHHVHPAALRIAYAAKGPEQFILVTDAMPPVGSALSEFRLGGRRILVAEGRCAAEDGTLAGSVLDMASAVRNARTILGIDMATAIRLASRAPARALRLEGVQGDIRVGLRADFALLDKTDRVVNTWIGGVATH